MPKAKENDDKEDLNTGPIGAIFWEPLYHNSIIIDQEGREERFEWLQLGDDPQYKIDEQLQERVREAAKKACQSKDVKNFNPSSRNTTIYSI